MTGGAYSISEDVTPAGQGAPPHIHRRELETFIVLEGEYEFQCGDRKFKAAKGAIVVLPREAPHAFKNTGNYHRQDSRRSGTRWDGEGVRGDQRDAVGTTGHRKGQRDHDEIWSRVPPNRLA